MYTMLDIMKKGTFEARLGEKVRQIRLSKSPRMSLESLAESSGLSRVTVNNLELGKLPEVGLDTVMKVARALQVPIGVLVDDEYTVEAARALELIRALQGKEERKKKRA